MSLYVVCIISIGHLSVSLYCLFGNCKLGFCTRQSTAMYIVIFLMDRLDAQLFECPTVRSHFSLVSRSLSLLSQKVVDKSFSSSTLCSLCKYTIVLCFIITDDNPPGTPAYKIILLVIAIIIVLAIACLTNGRVDLSCCVELIIECISD